MASEKGAPFPIVMIGACVVAVFWAFGHPWLGVLVVLVPVLLVTVPSLLGVVTIALFMALCAVAYIPVLILRLFPHKETP